MNELAKLMIELQKIDSAIVTNEKQLASYPKKMRSLDSSADSARQRLDSVKTKMKEALATRKLLETEIGKKQDDVRKFEKQQMEVKSNKEFQALTHQIATIKEAIGVQETEALEMMENESGIQTLIDEAQDGVRHAEREAKEEKSRMEGLAVEKKKRLEGLRDERDVLIARVPEDLAEVYENVFEEHPGDAIVSTDGKTCSGCNMNMLASIVQRIKDTGNLVACSNCRRLMYLKD